MAFVGSAATGHDEWTFPTDNIWQLLEFEFELDFFVSSINPDLCSHSDSNDLDGFGI